MRKILFLFAAGLALVATPVQAQVVFDSAGDFISTYAGPQAADVDVLSARVSYDGTKFYLTANMAGNIGQTSGALYVWGFDRGQGTARFSPAIANTENIKFDSVVLMRPDGSVTVNRIVGGGATNFGAGSATINGSSMMFGFDASLLPSLGFATSDYTWNLWPRVGTGNNNQISDFAPNTSNALSVAAPEPASCAFLLLTLPLIARRRKK